MDTPDDENPFSKKKPGGAARTIMILGAVVPLSVGGGILLGANLFPTKVAAPPVASVVKPAPEPVPSAAPPMTLVEKATAGDFKAVDELKARPAAQRSVDETIALARGRAHNRAAGLEGFGKEIKKDPAVLDNKDQLLRLKEFLNDRETAVEAAAIIVGLPGTKGPDMLYEVVSSPKGRVETAQLAEDLLATKEARDKASPALLVTLDLRKTEACEEFKTMLPRVAELADRRAMPTLTKLSSKKGCGDTKRDDCWECLRPLEKDKEAIDLIDAVKAAQKRPVPKT